MDDYFDKLMRDFNEQRDTITIISEPGALVFATRKKWKDLPEKIMDELNRHEVINVFKGTSSTFILLRKANPRMYLICWEELRCLLLDSQLYQEKSKTIIIKTL